MPLNAHLSQLPAPGEYVKLAIAETRDAIPEGILYDAAAALAELPKGERAAKMESVLREAGWYRQITDMITTGMLVLAGSELHPHRKWGIAK